MSVHRYAAKRDANEKEIIKALKQVGASVYQISGEGVSDLLVGFRGATYLLETKQKSGRLTDPQKYFLETWRGGTIAIVRTVDEALKAIGAIS